MFRTKALLGLMLAGFIGSASAVGTNHLGNLSGNSFAIGNSFFVPLSTINDVYTFDIMTLSSVTVAVVSINMDIPMFPGTEFAISNFRIELRNAADSLIAFDTPTAPNDYTLNLSANLPAATGYRFVVLGDVAGTLGGTYGGALAAAPVPEAETYAMMLAGLGLVGFMVARRRARNGVRHDSTDC